jgi:hypothetical protein
MQYEKFEDKGQSVAVNRSTMAKRKGTRGQAQGLICSESDVRMEQYVYPRTVVSVSWHYKNPTKSVGLEQSGYQYHLIEYKLFSP